MLRPDLPGKILFLLIICLGIGICTIPGEAGVRYFSGGPDLSVSLDSTNQLIPGSTIVLPLVVENKGKNTMELYNEYTIQPDYVPTTAKFATVTLLPGNAPVRVKSDPQIVGDIASGAVIPVSFLTEVPQDAPAGTYAMQAIITYQYVPVAEQQTTTDIEYTFRNGKANITVPVVIRPMVILTVDDVTTGNLSAGGDGLVTFTLSNAGQDTGNRTSIYLVPEGASPIVPYSSGVYIGTFPPNGTSEAKFKVAVSSDADHDQTYPVSLYAVYRDYEGNTATSPQVSTGVNFSRKITFATTSQPSVIHPGTTGIVNVTYVNRGSTKVYNAQARISVVDPFSSDDDTAYLGNLQPGESATALFSVKTDAGATIKTYSVNSEVQYTDSANNAFVSDNIPVLVDVRPASGMVVYAGIAAIIILIAFGILWHRKKQFSGKKE